MPFSIPDCYEADRQFKCMDLAYTARIARRGRCEVCDGFLSGEECLDLSAFGISGYACAGCLRKSIILTEDLDEV